MPPPGLTELEGLEMFISLVVLLSLVILTIGCVVLVKNREQQPEQPDSPEYLAALEQQQQYRKQYPYPAPYHIEQIVSEHLEATKGKN